MVVVSIKVSIDQWVGCPVTGMTGQILFTPFVGVDGDTYVYVNYPDGLYVSPLRDLIL